MVSIKRIELKKNIWKDERGWGTSPIEAVRIKTESMGSLHVASIRPGCIRGTHYNTDSTEWLILFGGPARFYWRFRKEDAIHEELIQDAEPILFEIPPEVEHAILNISESDIFLMAFSDSKKRDTIRTFLVK